MMRLRVQACLPATAFAALAWVITGTAGIPPIESLLAALSVALATVPSGWLAPKGWTRRAAEGMILLPALALVLVADPTLRRVALPPLLAVAALATGAAALRTVAQRDRPVLVVALALAVRMAGGLGLVGYPAWRDALAVAAVVVVAGLAGRVLNPRAALVVALLIGAAPLERALLPTMLGVAAAAVLLTVAASRPTLSDRIVSGWSSALTAIGLTAVSLAPWGGISLSRAIPAAGWTLAGAGGAALIATPFLPPALAGVAWLGVACLSGPTQPAPPDRPGLELTAARPEAVLPVSEGGLYIVETSLANSRLLGQGTVVAFVRDLGRDVPIRIGIDTAEWAHERDDVRPVAAHTLPAIAVWRPEGYGKRSTWAVAGRLQGQLRAGFRPRLVRDEHLAPEVVVGVSTAGSSRPTPPRDWPLPSWILAAATVVVALQLAGRTWGSPAAIVPWALLTILSLAARGSVTPLRLLAERHGVDLALAALLAAWLPLARVWLARRRTFLAAAALLVPLALATPHLTPPLYGDEPFHLIVLESLARDHDLDLANNYDLDHHPYNWIYITGKVFLHSPVMAFLLLPGYLVGGRAGALCLLALAGAGVTALVARRACELGASPRRAAILACGVLLTYPLATFSTQIWVEVLGALAAAACLVLLARPQAQRAAVTAIAAITVAVKTRLGLVLGPLALAAWWPRRRRPREFATGAVGLGVAMAAALAVEALFLGHPLGLRRLPDLVPHDFRQSGLAICGLAFDPSGGLAFAAPLALLSVVGLPALWRRGGWGERCVLLGGALTVAALLHSREWYGGGAPPARYLIPFLPAFALAFAQVPRSPALRALRAIVVPLSLFTWWVFVTRPHLTINPGDGGWWLADALARRFSADARHLVPSFLRPSPATVIVPAIALGAALGVALIGRAFPPFARAVARAAASIGLVTACVFLMVLTHRTDRVVEVEDPQVAHLGGTIEPRKGTFSRFLLPNGWRVHDGEGVEVPLNLAHGARLRLEGWLEGAARTGATLAVRWDGVVARLVPVAGVAHGSVELPPSPSEGHHRLGIVFEAPGGGEAVLDRIVVQP
ncbi:MAG: hypothetical protein LAO05_03005 [Acidobacteriia bacterium]|nr:hypothetical protein [Terriglobia bacterium]